MNIKKIACLLSISLCLSAGNFIDVKAAVTPERIWGADRYDTSVFVSRNGWGATSDYAIIASGQEFGDALSAVPLAKKYNAPILLVANNSLDNENHSINNVSGELRRLKVKKVLLVGGTAAVSTNVEKAITDIGIEIERIAGKDKYETSLEITKKVGLDNGVFVTTGESFQDALAIAPIAAAKGMSIILVPKDNLPENLAEYIKTNNISKTYVMGGTSLVSENISKQFANVERIGGNSEYERNINAINKFSKDMNYNTVYIASDRDFSDSLSGAALAAITSSPVILVGDEPEVSTKNYFRGNLKNIGQINVLGGEGVVGASALQQLVPVATSQAINSGLLRASLNQNNITSMQSDNNIKLDASAQGLSEDQQTQADNIVPLINNSSLNTNIKIKSNKDKTLSTVQEDINIRYGEMPIKTTAWITTDISGVQPKIKEIIKIPAIASMSFPQQFRGKKYMIMDPVADSTETTSGAVNFNDFTTFSKNFQPEFQSFMEKYAESWNPGFKFINYKGLTKLDTKEGTKYAQTYQLKLTDATLKALLNYTATDFVQNKDSIDIIKQFMGSIIDLSGGEDKDTEKKDMEKAFDDMASNPQQAIGQIKVFMDTIKDLKIIGDKGIDITYYINDGYIIKETGIIDLQLDLKQLISVMNKLNNVTSDETAEEVKGLVKLGINFDTENYSINKEVKIELPQLTEDNSFNYIDLIKAQNTIEQPQIQSE